MDRRRMGRGPARHRTIFQVVLLPIPILADTAQILVPGENLFISRFILDLPPLPLMPLRAFCMA